MKATKCTNLDSDFDESQATHDHQAWTVSFSICVCCYQVDFKFILAMFSDKRMCIHTHAHTLGGRLSCKVLATIDALRVFGCAAPK